MSPNKQTTILIVDDTPENIKILTALLKNDYKTKIATNGIDALNIANIYPMPDLILLDIMMPNMDGYEVCRRLKANPQTCDIPVIYITAKTSITDEEKGFEAGAVDYIFKPISPPILLARVKTHMQLQQSKALLKNENQSLHGSLQEQKQHKETLEDIAMIAMGALAESRDPETGNHIFRTQYYVKALALQLKDHPNFAHYLDDAMIGLLFKTAPLHDIGKVGIPDDILLKPGRLTTEEFEVMKKHPLFGYTALQRAMDQSNKKELFLEVACEIAYGHHEKWDGSGYPQALAGNDIPIPARLMALADVFDALISERVYKPAFDFDTTDKLILEGRGTHFDPDIVDAYCAIKHDFLAIYNEYRE
ncbi:MAG: two-component system response regulator [Saccharospirillaceae bacterium]|nr:two-component system response regulator [Pseudomonadales bacterium]NRB80783.1 two-component system response regulator [Saccharospirillaceae bacterium]